ncbi:MAG: cell division protein ZapA [Tissierellia bacterium]|nr:cell division protein ZapA [Tissierellia bacterium]
MKRTKVEIDGMQFQVVGNDDSEYIRDMAEDLTNRIEEIRNANYRLNQVQSLILTALNILDEKKKLDNRFEELSTADPKAGLSKEYLEEMDQIKQELSAEKEDGAIIKDQNKKFKNKIKQLEEKIKENSKKLNTSLEEGQKLKEQMKILEKDKKKLEEGNLKAQKEIVDLNKEISLLSGKGDAK